MLWTRQVEHVSQDDKSVAVATVVAAVDQARSRGPSEAAVSGEQVDPHRLLPSLHLLFKLPRLSPHSPFFTFSSLLSRFFCPFSLFTCQRGLLEILAANVAFTLFTLTLLL